MNPTEKVLTEIDVGNQVRKCYICGRTEEECLKTLGLDSLGTLVQGKIAAINARRLGKIGEIKKELEQMLADVEKYPDDVSLDEAVASEKMTEKFMPRVKDLLKFPPIPEKESSQDDYYYIAPARRKSRVQHGTIGTVKKQIANYIASLGHGEVPPDMKEWDPYGWKAIQGEASEKIPENSTVTLPPGLRLSKFTISFAADFKGRTVFYHDGSHDERDSYWHVPDPGPCAYFDVSRTEDKYKVNPERVIRYKISTYLCGMCASLFNQASAGASAVLEEEERRRNED